MGWLDRLERRFPDQKATSGQARLPGFSIAPRKAGNGRPGCQLMPIRPESINKSITYGCRPRSRPWRAEVLRSRFRYPLVMTNPLQTRYLGLELRNPLVVSACSLTKDPDNIAQMEEAGAGAVVLHSLFEEQIEDSRPGKIEYLDLIGAARERVDLPIIASLNGVTAEGWIDYAKLMQQAGADAIELNMFFIPADIEMTGIEVERRYLAIAHRIVEMVEIPVAVKLNPYLSATGHFATEMKQAGISGLVLFNRLYQPDYDIERLQITTELTLSEPNDALLPLMWIAALHGRVDISLAASTGVQGGREIIKYLLAGADVVMTATSLYKHGINHLLTMTRELEDWMQRKDFASVDAIRGMLSQKNIGDPTGYERANYIRILEKAFNQ